MCLLPQFTHVQRLEEFYHGMAFFRVYAEVFFNDRNNGLWSDCRATKEILTASKQPPGFREPFPDDWEEQRGKFLAAAS